MPKLVVSLVTYNSKNTLARCLESVANQTFRDFELICRDNHSSDGSADGVRRAYPSAHCIQSPTNEGFSRAHNATIRDTTSPYLCILNADLILDPSYFEECVSFLDAHHGAAAVSGLLVKVHSLTEPVHSDTIDSSGIVLFRTGRAANADAGKSIEAFKKITQRIGVPATAAVYRRAALEDISLKICTCQRMRHSQSDGVQGGSDERSKAYMEIRRRAPELATQQSADCECRIEYFDEDFFMYKEDVDVALRLTLRGWRSYAIPTSRAYHMRSTDENILKRPSPFINRLSYRNHWFVLLKDLPRSFWLRNGFRILFFESAKLLYLLMREPSTLAALFDVLKLREKMLQKRAFIMERAKVKSIKLKA
ncbi:glycosyltransferase family 2 protein [Candidatus Uhrbacteria bacterium]|nr:glycosyltransferase family 2 protein [Candidatus Uhrbacteria bacterium]